MVSQSKRITCSCAFQTQALRLSLSDARFVENPAAAWGPTRSAARAVLTLVLSQCERPDCSGTETGSQVEYRTSTDPTFDRTMRRSHPTGTTRPADFSEENNRKRAKYKPNVQLYDEKHQPNPRFPMNRHNTTNDFFDERSSKCLWETWKKVVVPQYHLLSPKQDFSK